MSDVIKQTADAFSAKNKTLKVFFFSQKGNEIATVTFFTCSYYFHVLLFNGVGKILSLP